MYYRYVHALGKKNAASDKLINCYRNFFAEMDNYRIALNV